MNRNIYDLIRRMEETIASLILTCWCLGIVQVAMIVTFYFVVCR